MIGIVLVSHSAALAEATRELALQMAGSAPPPLRVAAGVEGGLGTDAVAIAEALDELAECDGILVIPDLGSAVLSAGLALELREGSRPVVVGDGPFVEGAVAAVVAAAAGLDLDAVAQEAATALRAKRDDPGDVAPAASADGLTAERVLRVPMGLHARPAAQLARAAAGWDAVVEIADLTTGRGPADASSVVALLALGAADGHALRVEARGAEAEAALDAVLALVDDGFGEAYASADPG